MYFFSFPVVCLLYPASVYRSHGAHSCKKENLCEPFCIKGEFQWHEFVGCHCAFTIDDQMLGGGALDVPNWPEQSTLFACRCWHHWLPCPNAISPVWTSLGVLKAWFMQSNTTTTSESGNECCALTLLAKKTLYHAGITICNVHFTYFSNWPAYFSHLSIDIFGYVQYKYCSFLVLDLELSSVLNCWCFG